MGRKYVYLGRKVEDVGEEGLDTVEECRKIADAILEDFREGRISYRTAMSRLNLLELIAERNSKFTSYEATACRDYVDEVREELMYYAED